MRRFVSVLLACAMLAIAVPSVGSAEEARSGRRGLLSLRLPDKAAVFQLVVGIVVFSLAATQYKRR